MRLWNVIRNPQFKLNNVVMWQALMRKLRNKIRVVLIGRCPKILYLTRRKKHFSNFSVSMKFLAGLEDKSGIRQRLQAYDRVCTEILQQADKVLSHYFNLLGSGEVDLGSKIDWYRDFKSGYRWSPQYYQLIETGRARGDWQGKKADIKVPWEISRFQHLVVLGQAYWLSNNEKYTREFMKEIESWIEDNPPEIGPNWVCSMDISMRVVSLILAYFFFRTSPIIKKSFWERYFNLLYYSGVHIEQNPEVRFDGYRCNHYLTNCAAMIWLGLFFGTYNRKTKRWLKDGLENLSTEMEFQVNPDGGDFEGSISYHRLALEIFLVTTILARQNGLTFSDNYRARLIKMCEFSLNYLKPNGLAPQFGDVDDGRFCIFSGYGTGDLRDHRSLMGVAGEYFQRDDFRKVAADKIMDGLWLFGHHEQPGNSLTVCPELVSYPETGFYIIRKDEVFLMLKCGSIGQKNVGGHDHNDQLSFELNIKGIDLIIDPGSYVYSMDKDLRHLFRSTKYHNVSQIGNLEQNIIKNEVKNDMFTMYSFNPGKCTFFNKTFTESFKFAGEITIAETEIQYGRFVEMFYTEKRIDIVDIFSHSPESGTCRLHLAKDVKVEQLGKRTVLVRCGNVQARIEADMPIRVEPGMVSSSYGIKFDSWILSWDFQNQTAFKIYY